MSIGRGKTIRKPAGDQPQEAQTVIIRHGIAPTFNPGPGFPVMYFENGTAAPIAAQATLSDADSPDFNTGSLTVSIASPGALDQLTVRNDGAGSGQIGLSGNQVTYEGVTIGTVAGGANGGNLVVTFNSAAATPAAVQALVRAVTFASTDEALQSGPRTFTLVVNDGDGDSAQIQTNIQALGVNDAPVLADLGAGPIAYASGAAPLRLDTDASVTDIDSPDFNGGSLTLSITGGKVNAEDVLGLATDAVVTVAGNVVSVGGVAIGTLSGGGAGDLVIAFNTTDATQARVSELIRHLTYWDSSGAATLGTRTLSLTVRDGDGAGMGGGVDNVVATLDVQVGPGGPPPEGLPPSFSNSTHAPLMFIENHAFPVQIARTALLTDADSPNFGGGSLSVSKVDATATDQLGIGSGEGISRSGNNVLYSNVVIGTVSGGANGSSLTVSFNANATPAAAEQLVRFLTYRTTSEAPTDGLATFTIAVVDDHANLAQISSTVHVVAVNDAPAIANLYGDFTLFTTGGPPVRLDVGTLATASDIDGVNFAGGTLEAEVTGGIAAAEDELGFAAGSGVTMSGGFLLVDGVVIGNVFNAGGPGGGMLRFGLNADATHARVSQVLQSFTYWNSDPTPTDSLKTITVVLDDGDGNNFGGVSTTLAAVQVQVGNPVPPPAISLGSTLTTDVAMSADGTRIYEATDTGFVRVYDAGTGAVLANWDVGNHLGAISVSPDGSFLMVVERQVLGEADGNSTVTAYRVDLTTGAVTSFITLMPGMNSAFWDVVVLDDHRVLFPGTFNGTVGVPPRVLDLTTGVYTESAFVGGGATPVSTSPDRSLILFAPAGNSSGPLLTLALGADNTVSITHQTDLFAAGTSGFNHGMQAVGTAAGYIAQDAGGLHIYDLALNYLFDLNQSGTLFHSGSVAGLAFDPDGEFLFVLDAESNNIRQIVSLADHNVVRTILVQGADVFQVWAVNNAFVTYADRLLLTGDLGRFVVESGQAIVRIDAAMPSLNLAGDANANELNGSIGDDVLDGGGGADIMRGGHGDDVYYVDNAGDAVVDEVAFKGHDRVAASVSYTLLAGAAIERLEAIDLGGTAAIDLTGSDFANTILGNAGANVLRGEGGNDVLNGFGGNDALVGGTGADTMTGGFGDDSYYVDHASDVVNEATGQGNDRIAASASYVVAAGAEIEQLEAINSADTAAMDLTANDFVNLVIGNNGVNFLRGEGANDQLIAYGGNDFLIGGTGADLMYGGTGNDTFYVDDIGDRAYELNGEGTDRIATLITYTLDDASEIELLESTNTLATNAMDLTGSSSANQIIGNAGVNFLYGAGGNDQLVGLGGNDSLIGGTGADLMYGGFGDDTYYVDNLGDQANEVAGQGNDRIATSISYTLDGAFEVELLEAVNLSATDAMDLTGSDSGQTIIGNDGVNFLFGAGGNDQLIARAGNDSLIGGTGNDVMYGGTGNDTYYVDSATDQANEFNGEGNDRVAASASYALGAASEIETLEAVNGADTSAMDLTGNDIVNTITGNNGANALDGKGGNDVLIARAGNDTLIGGSGDDAMYGGTGDDTYQVDSAGDQANELTGEGNDRVATSVSYTLAAASEIETLEAANSAGTSAMDLTGNGIANAINGNAGANVIDGKGGNDVLTGLGGADTFAFTTAPAGGNVDRIVDFVAGTDKIGLDDAIFGTFTANAFVAGTQAQDADDRIVYDAATGNLYFDADGNGAGAQVLFATLDTHPALAAGDFTVI